MTEPEKWFKNSLRKTVLLRCVQYTYYEQNKNHQTVQF